MENLAPQEFATTVLPEVIAGAERLSAVFLTYHSLDQYVDETNLAELADRGLHIFVSDSRMGDNIEYLISGILHGAERIAFGDMTAIRRDIDRHTAECRQGLSEATANLSKNREALLAGDKAIVVVYAGLSAFEEGLNVARRFHQEAPNAFVVVLTCDCNLRAKQSALDTAVANQEIQAVVVTDECGGRAAMACFIDKLADIWPVVVH